MFTERGKELITDSIAAVEDLEAEFSGHLGRARVEQMKNVMARIYRSLHLEEDIFGHADSNDIGILARQLTRKLGVEEAKALARLILSTETDK